METLFNLKKTNDEDEDPPLDMVYYEKKFASINYVIKKIEDEHFSSTNLLEMSHMDFPEKNIKVMTFLRPLKKTQSRSLNGYPRINMPKWIRDLPEEERVPAMVELFKKTGYYFLVIMPRVLDEPIYWLEQCCDIDPNAWEKTYRRKSKLLDRIYLPGTVKCKFLRLRQLGVKLNLINK